MSKIEKMSKEERAELDRLLHEDRIDEIDPEVLAEVDAGMEEMDAAIKRGREWYRKQPFTLPARRLMDEDIGILSTVEWETYEHGYIVSLERFVEGRFIKYSTKCKLNIDLDKKTRECARFTLWGWLYRTNRIMEKV